jgi:uncharacterized repeat protein (TIGR01451 family)
MRAEPTLVSIARMRSTPAPIGGTQDARRRLWQILVVALAAWPLGAQAAGTAAGTAIQSTATVNFSIGGTPASTTSNTTTVTVAEILNVSVVLQSPTVQTSAGAIARPLVFRVTNTGNSSETFALAGNSMLTGDDFDPAPATPFLYIDMDLSGDLSAPDVPYVAGSNDPVLAADASVGVIVVNDIPAGIADGSRGRSELHASARTGVGTPGTLFAGQGTGGVDAIVGTSGAQAAVYGEYLVGSISLSAVKSQTVTDPFGGSQPVPGATIHYQVVVSATGSGTAVGALFRDGIPANTTYVAASLKRNGAALTDAADADAGTFVATPAPEVDVALGDLTAAAGAQTLEFSVTIN